MTATSTGQLRASHKAAASVEAGTALVRLDDDSATDAAVVGHKAATLARPPRRGDTTASISQNGCSLSRSPTRWGVLYVSYPLPSPREKEAGHERIATH